MPHSGKPAELLAEAGHRRRAHRGRRSAASRRCRLRLAPEYPVAVASSSHPSLRKELSGSAALRRCLVQGRAPGPDRAFRPERRRQDDAAPDAQSARPRYHGGELVFAKGTRIALHDQRPPLDQRPDAARVRAHGRARPRRDRGGAARRWSRQMAAATTTRDAAALRGGAGAARARRRLRLARPRGLASCAASASPSAISTGRSRRSPAAS